MEWWRLAPALGIFLLIEFVDHNVEAISLPWWLSAIMSLVLSFADILFILIMDFISD